MNPGIPEAGVGEPDKVPLQQPQDDEPTPIDNWDAVKYYQARLPSAQYYRLAFDRNFFRNILFYAGVQWIRLNRQTNQWKTLKLPDWFPKQVTNKFAVACNMMKSVFLQSDPQSIYSPASNDIADIASAAVAEDISRYVEQTVEQSTLEQQAASWNVLTGNYFIVDGYDTSESHGTKFVQDSMCPKCLTVFPAADAPNLCPKCGTPPMPAVDPSGQPIGDNVPIGQIYSEIASPFEVHFDMVARDFDSSPYAILTRTYPIDDLKEMFPEFKDRIRAESSGVDTGMFFQTSLAYLVNGVAGSVGAGYGSVGAVDSVPRATLAHLYVRPTKNLPNGGEALIIGDVCVWKGELSYKDEEGNRFIPIVHGGFDDSPGRVFKKTPADDLIWKQIQRNKIEAFIQLGIEKTGNPVWLRPLGSGAKVITGQPGQIVDYNGLGGLKPERVPGMEISNSTFRFVTSIDQDIQDISHTYDVMRGEVPKGIPTLGGAQLILERGFAGFSDALKSWGHAWNTSRRNRLRIWKQFCVDERTMMVLGKNKKWEAKKFSSSNLSGRINVYLDEASLAPKSKAYQQLITGQLLQTNPQTGLINTQDPSVKLRIMSIFDANDLIEDLDIDVKDAAKEKDEFNETGQLRFRPTIDNNEIHSLEHKKVAKSDEFFSWPIEKQQAWLQHCAQTDAAIAQQRQAAMQSDPRMQAQALKIKEIEAELQALQQEEQIKLQSLSAKKQIDLQSHGAKKGLDLQADGARHGIERVLGTVTKK
ncbi:MAG: hypothetical protein KGL39_14500 [Patescibacteria group bacterium]|nr:hypothetical protein [Patescibacteria group bacterium]